MRPLIKVLLPDTHSQRDADLLGESSLRTFTKLSQLFLSIAFGSNLKICFAGFAVNGGLRCLSMIASDIDEAQMPQVRASLQLRRELRLTTLI